jgi:DNA polymerase-1
MGHRNLLIDGDVLVYKAAFATQENFDWGDGMWSNVSHLPKAQEYLERRIDEMVEQFKARPIICLSDSQANWRKEIYPEYKKQRKKTHKPTLYRPIRDWFRQNFDFYQKDRMEADDLMGIISTAGSKLVKGPKLICTIDKDLLQIPGKHFNFDKPSEGVKTITKSEGDRFFYEQILTGDQVDNIPGCPGVGPKTADKILDKVYEEGENIWNAIKATYLKKGLYADYALTQARICRICRAEDYDFKKKEVILWSP